MFTKPGNQKSRNDRDFVSRTIGQISEETEKFADSISTQITGNVEGSSDQPNPITEAMQQKTDIPDADKQKLSNQKRFIRTREELNNELEMLKRKAMEDEKARLEDTDRQFKIVSPGEDMSEKPALPMTSKPKRGQTPGKPGTSKGETGAEVRKSKQ